MLSAMLHGYTVELRNGSNTTWNMKVNVKGTVDWGPAGTTCPDHERRISPGETKKVETKGCCISKISNRDTGETQELGGSAFADCQDFAVNVVNDDGKFTFSGVNTPLSDVVEQVTSAFEDEVASFFKEDVPNAFEKAAEKIEEAAKQSWDRARRTFLAGVREIASDLNVDWDKIADLVGEIHGQGDLGVRIFKAILDQQKHHIDASEVKNAFQEPHGSLRFDDAMFLGSHNAFAHPPVYDLYYQHEEDIATQFKFGVRAFELDTEKHNGAVRLCHRTCSGGFAFAMTGYKDPDTRTLSDVFDEIYNLTSDNPDSVVTIKIEDRAGAQEIQRVIDQKPQFKKRLVTSDDWVLSDHNNRWPKLRWMRDNDKRIVIFFQGEGHLSSGWKLWQDAKENDFAASPTSVPYVCAHRSGSEGKGDDRSFYIFDYIQEATWTFDEAYELLRHNKVEEVINNCATFHPYRFRMMSGGMRIPNVIKQYPNVINTDRTEALMVMHNRGDKSLMDYINDRNRDMAS